MFGFKIVKAEKRQEDYTEALLAAAQTTLSGGSVDIKKTASIATAASLVGRCLAISKVSPDRLKTAFTATMLFDLGRDLIESGEAVYRISIKGGRINLERASTWRITGKTQWFYNLEIPSPSGKGQFHFSSAEAVFHPRINAHKATPWKGRGAGELASSTATLLGSLEKIMANELKNGSGYILPIPSITPGEADNLQKKLVGLKGGSVLVPSATFAQDRESAGNYKPSRVGADFPETYSALRLDLHEAILNSIGISLSLFSSGANSREAYRLFLHTALSPIISAVETEARLKLDESLSLSPEALFAADVVGRSRAFGSMIKGGMDVSKAAALSGLITAEED